MHIPTPPQNNTTRCSPEQYCWNAHQHWKFTVAHLCNNNMGFQHGNQGFCKNNFSKKTNEQYFLRRANVAFTQGCLVPKKEWSLLLILDLCTLNRYLKKSRILILVALTWVVYHVNLYLQRNILSYLYLFHKYRSPFSSNEIEGLMVDRTAGVCVISRLLITICHSEILQCSWKRTSGYECNSSSLIAWVRFRLFPRDSLRENVP